MGENSERVPPVWRDFSDDAGRCGCRHCERLRNDEAAHADALRRYLAGRRGDGA